MTSFVILLILFVLYVLFSCYVFSGLTSKINDLKRDSSDFDLILFIYKVNDIQETLESLKIEMQSLQKRIQ